MTAERPDRIAGERTLSRRFRPRLRPRPRLREGEPRALATLHKRGTIPFEQLEAAVVRQEEVGERDNNQASPTPDCARPREAQAGHHGIQASAHKALTIFL